MKLNDPLALCRAETTAPALSRGLAIMASLAEEAPLSLEKLSSRLSLPKASVFRLLGTLETVGMIRKTAQKTYEPLWQFQPAADPRVLLRNKLEGRMSALAEATGCTIEWYEPATEGMRLVLQKHPQSELCVKVGPGFVRIWGVELEAVTLLGYALYPQAPAPEPIDFYVSNGVKKTLSPAKASRHIAQAREEKTAADHAYNTNGVRRFAVSVSDPETGDFLGVLALAEAYHFNERPGVDTYFEQLNNLLQ